MKKYSIVSNRRRAVTYAEIKYRFSFHLMNALLKVFFLIITLMLLVGFANAQKTMYFNNLNSHGVILDGYDAVAFFTDNKPVKGDAAFQHNYEGATYYFTSADHLNLFKATPEKYKPQFGGWCAYAVSLGRIAPIDVNNFSIVDGRLFIQHNQRAVAGWNKDVPGNIVKADKYWPEVAAHNGKQITTDEEKGFYNNISEEGIIMNGYDAVAYFTDQAPVKGKAEYAARYNGATYLFASQEHADMFKNNPEMFAPLYGSFCGYAMAFGRRRPVNPEFWNVVDGRLILQHSKGAWDLFNKDIPKFKAQADQQWPPIMKENAGKKVKYDKPV
jgi:YHS domain-containing protein